MAERLSDVGVYDGVPRPIDGARVIAFSGRERGARARFAARATLRLAARFGFLADLRTARPDLRAALRTLRLVFRPDLRTARLTLRADLRRLLVTRRFARLTRRTVFLAFRLAAMGNSPKIVVETDQRRTGSGAPYAS
ncbi:MAG: hypothetical protein ACREGK_12700 [Geminicoccales bacterium]